MGVQLIPSSDPLTAHGICCGVVSASQPGRLPPQSSHLRRVLLPLTFFIQGKIAILGSARTAISYMRFKTNQKGNFTQENP